MAKPKKPGAEVRLLRQRLKNNADATMKQLAWNILEHARQLVMQNDQVSKGTLLASWVLGIGTQNTWTAPTEYAPYSWEEGNEIRTRYAGLVRQSYTAAMTATFSVPIVISNNTPYLYQSINTNPHLGGTSDVPIENGQYASQLAAFARTEAKRLFSSMPLNRMMYQGAVV